MQSHITRTITRTILSLVVGLRSHCEILPFALHLVGLRLGLLNGDRERWLAVTKRCFGSPCPLEKKFENRARNYAMLFLLLPQLPSFQWNSAQLVGKRRGRP